MKSIFYLLIGLFCVASLIPGWAWVNKPNKVQKTGTFSSLYYNEEGGDLLGMELRIAYCGNKGYQGTLQVSEGAPGELILLKGVQIGGDGKISFSFVDEDSGNKKPITFTGKIDVEKITGSFTNHYWDKITVLKRKKSYWD